MMIIKYKTVFDEGINLYSSSIYNNLHEADHDYIVDYQLLNNNFYPLAQYYPKKCIIYSELRGKIVLYKISEEYIIAILTHEIIHKVLDEIDEYEACIKLDNVFCDAYTSEILVDPDLWERLR